MQKFWTLSLTTRISPGLILLHFLSTSKTACLGLWMLNWNISTAPAALPKMEPFWRDAAISQGREKLQGLNTPWLALLMQQQRICILGGCSNGKRPILFDFTDFFSHSYAGAADICLVC